ncbi:MAG: hypothetical protein GX584_05280 [Clostridiaceae bacterium]|jgi:hypothetical protein|nr:hypothetical protein [Clostridiaceae bacterium]
MRKVCKNLVLAIIVAIILSSCSSIKPIDKINMNNEITALLEKNSSVSLHISYMNMYGYDDVTYSMTGRMNDDKIEIVDNSEQEHISYFSDGIMNILVNNEDFYTVIMSDLVYDAYTSGYLENIDFNNYANYKLVSDKSDKGLREIVYSFEINDILTSEFSLWNLSKGETILSTYVLDNDWQIISHDFKLDVKGGDNLTLMTKTFTYGNELINNNILESYIQSQDRISVTIINTVNEEEEYITYSIPKGTYFGYDFSDSVMDLYYDSLCKDLFKYADQIIEQDITLYIGQSQYAGE